MNRIISLSDLKPNQQARLATIRTESLEQLLRSMQADVLPDACINVILRDERRVLFFTNYKELAVDQVLAQKPGKSV